MPGIYGTNYNNKIISKKENMLFKADDYMNWHLELCSITKFINDKCLVQSKDYIVLIDGVILNLCDLKKKYKKNTLFETSIAMYEKNGEQFFKNFRGNFCGFFFDKKKNICLIFTNHFGEKTIFYNIENNKIVFASELKDIIKLFKFCNKKYTLNKDGAYCLLTYGFMYDNLTLFNEIHKLLPGHYIKIKNDSISVKQYYEICNKCCENFDENEAIEKIEKLFNNAIEMQINKNKEYGYDNYSPLSAGLDSRITNYALKKYTSSPVINMTYSETNQFDYTIPAKISRELKNEWLFKNLDNGLALYEIDNSLKYTDGIIYYAWPSQLYNYMKYINVDKLGIIHTGVIGDVVIGTYYKENCSKEYEIGDGAFSNYNIKFLKDNIVEKKYKNYEQGMMYNRALNGAVLGYSTVFQNYTEAMSPFMNVELFDYCMSIPIRYRFHHNLYYKWVNRYYKNAIKYSHNGITIPKNSKLKVKFNGKKYSIKQVIDLLVLKIKSKVNKNYGMNPLDYWYNSNDHLKQILDNYFIDNIILIDDQILKNDVSTQYENGNTIEKIQVISLLAFMKEYFNGDNNEI